MSSPPLGELFDLLRADGFAIGVDDHVRVARLLACEAEWTPELLRTSIAALLVTDPEERKAFDACWERWMPRIGPPPPTETVRPALPPPRRRRSRTVVIVVAAFAAVAVGVLAVCAGSDASSERDAVSESNAVIANAEHVEAAKPAAPTPEVAKPSVTGAETAKSQVAKPPGGAKPEAKLQAAKPQAARPEPPRVDPAHANPVTKRVGLGGALEVDARSASAGGQTSDTSMTYRSITPPAHS